MGKRAVLVNPYSFLGGMTVAGLTAADVGNAAAVSGLAREYFLEIGKAYGEGFKKHFEPAVAEKAFEDFIKKSGVTVLNNERLARGDGVAMSGHRIKSIRTESGRIFAGAMFIDATYEGDLMADAHVTYTLGRESNDTYGETLNGFLLPTADLKEIADFGPMDQFIKDVDPFLKKGDRASGLLPGINPVRARRGDADGRLQAFNYRLTLTEDPNNRIPFEKPAGYREIDHELLLRNFEAGDDRLPGRMPKLPNGKYDWNTFGAVGTDLPGGNEGYVEGTYQDRIRIEKAHELYTRGHFWTLANHPRVPEAIRARASRLGYARDEFKRNDGFPYMIYVREARRMVSDAVMTEHHCLHREKADDPIGLASYWMDSHVVQYVVNERGFASREGVFQKTPKGPYGISYRSIVPKKGECENLFVPICVSASHAAYGSIRMEPIFMLLGQVSATAAAMAIDKRVTVQQVAYEPLSKRLAADGVTFTWEG